MKKRIKFLIAFLILFQFGLSQAFGGAYNFDQKFNELQKSMTLDQVKTLLGPPDLREVKGDLETWLYNANGGRQVIFDKSGVIEFGREQAPLPKPTMEPQGHDLDIGLACKEDSQCKNQNCHFHTCAGNNNCTVPLGKLCAVDSDCCSGYCDFGKCKKR